MNSVVKFFYYIKSFCAFLRDIVRSRQLIIELTKKDFQVRYLGSYLGMLWAFIQPFITVMIFWFVFEVGFKSKPVANFPFILWLVAGIIPWFFISESITNAANSIVENSYLVKKVVFRVSILPIIKILSALMVHFFFIGVLVVMFWVYGYPPKLYNLQVIYYLFATICLVVGFSWLTSSLIIFLKDVGQIIAMMMQFGFWVTPIFWSLNMVPESYRWLLVLNPAYYIVEGYRDSFIYGQWFWQQPGLTLYFWVVTSIIFVIGALAFKKLRVHFADVL